MKQPCQNSAAKGLPLYTHCRSQEAPAATTAAKIAEPIASSSQRVQTAVELNQNCNPPCPSRRRHQRHQVTSKSMEKSAAQTRRTATPTVADCGRQSAKPCLPCRNVGKLTIIKGSRTPTIPYQTDHHKGESNPNQNHFLTTKVVPGRYLCPG